MSDFTVNCPHCQQVIAVTPQHVGLEIACPTCQKNFTVPPNPAAPPPPPAKAGTRLSGVPAAAPTSTPPPPPGMQMGKPTKKPKKRLGPIIGVCTTIAVVVVFIFAWPYIMKMAKKADTEPVAVTNSAPPPPPELTTGEIMAKVDEAYKNLTDLSLHFQTSGELEVPAAKGTTKSVQSTGSGVLELARSDYYRLEWDVVSAGAHTTAAAWNSGKGNFLKVGAGAPNKVKTREAAIAPAETALLLSPLVMDVFFATTNSFTRNPSQFTRTNASEISAYSDYALIGEFEHQTVMIGIKKDSFLIEKIILVLAGGLDETELKKLPAAERAQLAVLAKMKGKVTEDYQDQKANQNLMASSFETSTKAAEANAKAAAANAAQNAAAAQRPGSRAGQLVAPIKRRQQAQPQPPQ